MPEGPEVWILSKAINLYYKEDYENKHNFKSASLGKHLIFHDLKESWSFGLTGQVHINEPDNILYKNETGWLYGEKTEYTNDNLKTELGIDWMEDSVDSLRAEVERWVNTKKRALLAGLMLNQKFICGIGVAWGSEILFRAGLRPDLRVCDQNLDKLVDTMIEVRKEIKELYETYLLNNSGDQNIVKKFIDNWFSNLYEAREDMIKIYKKGTKITVLGRNWWV